jgi:hypothetical protein
MPRGVMNEPVEFPIRHESRDFLNILEDISQGAIVEDQDDTRKNTKDET